MILLHQQENELENGMPGSASCPQALWVSYPGPHPLAWAQGTLFSKLMTPGSDKCSLKPSFP